ALSGRCVFNSTARLLAATLSRTYPVPNSKNPKNNRVPCTGGFVVGAKGLGGVLKAKTNPPQHALTLTNQTHLKLAALILEPHIAALDKTQKFGDILSKSPKTNFDIDTAFPDRDSAAIFNFCYDKTGTQQPHAKQTLPQETQKSHEPSKPQEPLKPQKQVTFIT
ncbi:hypothetical protein FHG87_024606, partial [Trinorchestia longiramus]